MPSPSLPDRRDTGNWLDRFCEWAVANPWRICLLILACIFVTSCLDNPDMSRSEAIAISAIVAGE